MKIVLQQSKLANYEFQYEKYFGYPSGTVCIEQEAHLLGVSKYRSTFSGVWGNNFRFVHMYLT